MPPTTTAGPIVVVDDALATQLLEDGERILDGLTALVEGLRAIAPAGVTDAAPPPPVIPHE